MVDLVTTTVKPRYNLRRVKPRQGEWVLGGAGAYLGRTGRWMSRVCILRLRPQSVHDSRTSRGMNSLEGGIH